MKFLSKKKYPATVICTNPKTSQIRIKKLKKSMRVGQKMSGTGLKSTKTNLGKRLGRKRKNGFPMVQDLLALSPAFPHDTQTSCSPRSGDLRRLHGGARPCSDERIAVCIRDSCISGASACIPSHNLDAKAYGHHTRNLNLQLRDLDFLRCNN